MLESEEECYSRAIRKFARETKCQLMLHLVCLQIMIPSVVLWQHKSC